MVIKRISEAVSMIKGLDKDTLQGIRYTLFFFIIIDIFLFYWWMKWKQFAIAVLMVCCIILVIVLLLERKFPPEEEEIDEDKKKIAPVFNKPKPEEKSQDFINMDLGLPDPNKYNKRLEKAIST